MACWGASGCKLFGFITWAEILPDGSVMSVDWSAAAEEGGKAASRQVVRVGVGEITSWLRLGVKRSSQYAPSRVTVIIQISRGYTDR